MPWTYPELRRSVAGATRPALIESASGGHPACVQLSKPITMARPSQNYDPDDLASPVPTLILNKAPSRRSCVR